ncbi:MAG: hypothetical protein ACI8RZ_001444 [Myxococcota bacterium]|jgi:hypothetical protein
MNAAEAITTHLLSGDYIPEGLAGRLKLDPVKQHPLTAWRLVGTWSTTYSGELGRMKTTHTTNTREVHSEAGMEVLIDGTTATNRMTWAPTEGTCGGDLDLIVVDGDVPSPPGPGWSRGVVRAAVLAGGVSADSAAVWAESGESQAEDVAGVGLRRHLNSPHLDRLTINTDLALTASMRAEVVVLEVTGTFDDAPLRILIGPDGTGWGAPPSDEARKEALSGGSAAVVIAVGVWGVLTLIGLFVFVLPGIVAAVLGVLHVRHLAGKRTGRIEGWRGAEQAGVGRVVDAVV